VVIHIMSRPLWAALRCTNRADQRLSELDALPHAGSEPVGASFDGNARHLQARGQHCPELASTTAGTFEASRGRSLIGLLNRPLCGARLRALSALGVSLVSDTGGQLTPERPLAAVSPDPLRL